MLSFVFNKTFYQELGYIATECRFGFSLDDTNESVLFPHFHYYEFVDSLFMNNVIMIDTLGKRISNNNYFHINNFSSNSTSQ